METWYQKYMPKIKDVSPFISDLFKEIYKDKGVKNIYVWGSYAKNINNPNFRVKDIDILAITKYFSGDFISINEPILAKASLIGYLEDQGYAPNVVKFSSNFTQINKYNIDHWAISCDKKLLHWGAILTNKQDSDNMNKEAERYAIDVSGIKKEKINTISETERKNWYQLYSNYISDYFKDMPSGWYQVENIKVKDVLNEAIKI